jgi:hypothetical protein
MKKLMTISFSVLLLLPMFVSAQKVMTEGYVRYEVTEVKSDDPQMESALNMMKGSTLEIYFTEKKQKSVMDMMGGMMKMNTINLVKEKQTVMLMDMMGKKIKVVGSEDEFKDMNKEAASKANDVKPEITVDKSKKKTIAGYPCYAAVIKLTQEGMDMSIDAYLTESLVAPKSVIQNVEEFDIPGLPLEYTINTMGFQMTYSATKVETKVASNEFDIPDGYEEMSIDDFMKNMGAMGGGMGF